MKLNLIDAPLKGITLAELLHRRDDVWCTHEQKNDQYFDGFFNDVVQASPKVSCFVFFIMFYYFFCWVSLVVVGCLLFVVEAVVGVGAGVGGLYNTLAHVETHVFFFSSLLHSYLFSPTTLLQYNSVENQQNYF